ncbi:MAG: SDR family NAD(P)-dependent oxidoreductase [Chitinophagaceae bacterium]|nr:SDR family NAD(P)-dependent oxidoreductase [Chitinophagaceae bacterium]
MRKTVLITGASKVGLALARTFLANDYKVIGTSRSGIIHDIKHPDFQSLSLDLSDLDSIRGFERHFQGNEVILDMLINNAGIGPDLDLEFPGEDSFQLTFAVNVTGTTFFTEQMSRQVAVGGKIINISSKMGSIAACELTDSVAYRMSKAALNMYTKILANRESEKRWVAAVHPGWVRTTLSKSNINGRLSPEESAERIFEFVVSDFKTGIFWNVETQTESKW